MRKRILSILLAIMGIALAVFLILACGRTRRGMLRLTPLPMACTAI